MRGCAVTNPGMDYIFDLYDVYLYMCVYTHMYVCVYIYMCIHVYLYAYMYVSISFICTYTYIGICSYIYTHDVHMRIYIYCLSIYLPIYRSIYFHIYIHMYMNIYMYIRAKIRLRALLSQSSVLGRAKPLQQGLCGLCWAVPRYGLGASKNQGPKYGPLT